MTEHDAFIERCLRAVFIAIMLVALLVTGVFLDLVIRGL